MKHAILVMGHGNLSIVEKYMQILDDERFDFYIHIDKKVRMMVGILQIFVRNLGFSLPKEFLSIGGIIVRPKQK